MDHVSILEFAKKMNEIMPIIVKEFAKRHADELYKGKITLPQFFILNFLFKEGESKMTDLAHFMNVTMAAMTGVVDRLVRNGYCIRTYNPKDRRIIKVKLTAKGNGLLNRINQQRRQMVINIFGKISESDRKDYLRILTKIRDILISEKVTVK